MSPRIAILAACLLLTTFSGATSAEKTSPLTNNTPLKQAQDQALDADGKPLPMPQNYAPALEYRAKEAKVNPVKVNAPKYKPPRSSPTAAIADDPSCRWLNSRMSELRKRLKSGSRLVEYLTEELQQYRQQWQCLKCSAAGPAAGDHARCGL
ncbi:hypothetical protein JYB87_18100 [Shewanella avicenniae]|uniref:Uncharacterized protein n=1 Tax=Shewanella avicenniae TaxID=2814294 RepID=A0ABX7QQB7_9GAMM|nr:hypothetical protein [Shewanella avicenniae]QSX33594.1 hypothetical protein JYB87_18100 [Shewanella avicenniae]